MEPRFSEEDVLRSLSPREALEAVRVALTAYGRGEIENQVRKRVSIGNTTLNMMAAAIPSLGVMGAKVYTVGPNGPYAYLCLYNADGLPLCIMEADELGRIRTAAVSALGTQLMARPDSKVMTLFGVGFQAETQLVAIADVMSLREVRVYSRNLEKVKNFCARMQERVSAKLIPVRDAQAAVEQSDIVTTSTNSSEPVLFGKWLKPGTHVNAIGNNRAYEREIDGEVVRLAQRIIVDSVEQAKMESGDLLLAEKDGCSVWDRVHGLSEILNNHLTGRESADEITMFKSNGLALEDVAVAHHIYNKLITK